MENYAYTSYPDSGDSSPRSREIDFENPTPPWDDQSHPQAQNYKVKFMCSYGGKIHPRPHDNQLSYISGETKILAVDRNIKFPVMLSKLSAICDSDVSFKYQLPGEDLDALISVTNDDDLEHMMHEYDRLYRASAKPARMRLFLFPLNSSSFGSDGSKSDRDRFVEALNSAPTQAAKTEAPDNGDYFFSLDKGVPPQQQQQPPPPPPKSHESVPEQVTPRPEFSIGASFDDRGAGSDPVMNQAEIQRQLQELQRLQIGGHEQAQDMYRRKSDENIVGPYAGDYYVQKMPEKSSPVNAPPMSAPPGYWPEKQISGGGFQGSVGAPEQPVYMIHSPAHGTVYHAPMMRQVTGQTGQGYYMQRMSPDVYREQPMYNVVPQQQLSAPPPVTMPQQPPKTAAAAYSEGMGMGMMRPGGGGGDMGMYAQVAYDSAGGRQVYYTSPGGVVPPPPQYQGVAAVSADMRPAGGLSQEGKVVSKVSQASV